MACGEFGPGRLPEPRSDRRVPQVERFPRREVSLVGKHVLVTAGPTHEPIDPVRVIANRSSGRQGFAIARRRRRAGRASNPDRRARVRWRRPPDVNRVNVETAEQMAEAVMAALPADVAILVAAVADWRVEASPTKLKKGDGPPKLKFVPNPRHSRRDIDPCTAASTGRRICGGNRPRCRKRHRQAGRQRRRLDRRQRRVRRCHGRARNRVHLVTGDGIEDWPEVRRKRSRAS